MADTFSYVILNTLMVMKDKNTIVLISLFVLTIGTAVASKFGSPLSWIVMVILGLSAIKFLLVAFQFMELKKAHKAWKILLVGYLIAFVGIVSLVLM